MKTVIKEIKVFTIEDAKKDPILMGKILDKHQDINTFQGWEEPITEGCIEDIELKGFENIDIAFSGFWSQGDGASFTGNVNVIKWIKANEPVKYRRLVGLIESGLIDTDDNKIKRSGNYVHENSTHLSLYFLMYGNLGTSAANVLGLLDELTEDIENSLISLNKTIYKALEAYYYELQEKDNIIETIEANDYEFTEDGNIY